STARTASGRRSPAGFPRGWNRPLARRLSLRARGVTRRPERRAAGRSGPTSIVTIAPAGAEMLYYYLIFFFVTVGAKLALALVMIYLLLPPNQRCGECEGETLLMEGHALVKLVTRWSPGRLQRRWCPRC